jgi:hypothetical protein
MGISETIDSYAEGVMTTTALAALGTALLAKVVQSSFLRPLTGVFLGILVLTAGSLHVLYPRPGRGRYPHLRVTTDVPSRSPGSVKVLVVRAIGAVAIAFGVFLLAVAVLRVL